MTAKPSVVSLSQLSEAVRAGVVLALEDRAATAVVGGSTLTTAIYPTIGILTTVGMMPPREPDYFIS